MEGGGVNLDRVTITGADDSIDPRSLAKLSHEFPFVEWGLLFSPRHQGEPRWPSNAWVTKLLDYSPGLHFSVHLCGKYVRDLVLLGLHTFDNFRLYDLAERVQLNFHGQFHKAGPEFAVALKRVPKAYILQMDSVNDALLEQYADFNVYPLFDISGGAGVLPEAWPKPMAEYTGYAGGLGPQNIEDQLIKIQSVVGDARIWIDMETHVRSNHDRTFDLAKVRRCLELAKPFVADVSPTKEAA